MVHTRIVIFLTPCPPKKRIPSEKNCHIITIIELLHSLPTPSKKLIPSQKNCHIITIIELLHSLPPAPQKLIPSEMFFFI